MRTLKRTIGILSIIILIVIIFRGPLYRSFIKYQPVQKRTDYAITNPELISVCELNGILGKDSSINDIIRKSLQITSEQLDFTFSKVASNPNELVNAHKANCIGYAAFFTVVCNYQFNELKYSGNWVATHYKGQLYLLGVNIHPYINSSFFKDHDFVIIENTSTGETYAVDPAVNDYFGVDFIALRAK